MQLHRRTVLLISAILVSLTLTSIGFAAVVQVTLTPLQTNQNQSVDFSLSVNDAGGDNINKVEITLPQDSNNVPLYQLSTIGNPAGWTYETRSSVGAASPFKIIWSTSGAGISSGTFLNFNFGAKAPSASGNQIFAWKVTDLKGVESSGTIAVTQPSLAKLDITGSNTTTAGSQLTLVVTALDQNGNPKTDYTGTVKFSSTDSQAILPSNYTFQSSDNGTKSFQITLKTAGNQAVRVSDGTFDNSFKVTVSSGATSYISLQLSNATVPSGNSVTLTVWAIDLYHNKADVTSQSIFSTDSQAKGSFIGNNYKSEVVGSWTLIAKYTEINQRFSDGQLLTIIPPSTTSTPTIVTQPVQQSGNSSLQITSDDTISVPVNSSKTFDVTIKNTGSTDLKTVSVTFGGIPTSQLNISPSSSDLAKGKSATFTVTIFPTEITPPRLVTFTAASSDVPIEKLNASKTVLVNITGPVAGEQPTGKFALDRNLTYLAVAIIGAVILIILFWALFSKEDKKKTEEHKKKDEQKQ